MRCSKPRQFSLHGFSGVFLRRVWIIKFGWLLGAALSTDLTARAGELVIIVNLQSGIERLTKAEVINIFLGRQKKLPSGKTALTVDLNGENSEKQQFYIQLVGKELAEINSYWARLIFSGQGSPPRQVETADEILDIVENNKGAIGYVDQAKADQQRVKVVYTLTD